MRAHEPFAFAVLLVTGCQVAGDPGVTASAVSVDLVFSDLGVKIARVYPVEDFPLYRFQAPASLRYELLDDSGHTVVTGIA